MEFLSNIHEPKDLRNLPPQVLKVVAEEIREFILKVISEKGGHFSSNLGAVELTVALHYIFDTPKDKLVFDVGHQSYPHKILTGRKDRFHTIRQQGGISGFTSRAESEFDHFGAGHASTSISAALGIAEGIRHRGLSNLSIAVIGDGSMTGGLAYEALNNAGHIPAKNLVVVFNDNNMSIDPNVGAIRQFVNHAVTHPSYNRLRKDLVLLLTSLSDHGVPFKNAAHKIRSSVKNIFTPGMLFECFGFRYFGPVNGHDLDALIETFAFIKNEGAENGPYLVHALTTKGKGYKLAEENSLIYHGVNPFPIENGITPSKGPKKVNYQDIFADTLIRLAKEDPRIVTITAAMPSGTGINKFQKEFPNRTYDVGIAEGHAVCFAAGLATEGFRPIAAIYSTFLQRAYDQVIHDVAIQNLPVIFALDRAGLVGNDGVTHQGAFDLSYLRAIPNLVLMAPKDENELQHMIYTSVQHQKGPIAFRYPRGEVVGVELDDQLKLLNIGEAELLNTDDEYVEVLLVGIGYAVQYMLEAQKLLKSQGVVTAAINARFAKPLDEKLLLRWAKKSKLVVTVEENSVCGGFGSAVSEVFHSQEINRELMIIGMPDLFVDHATQKAQRQELLLDAEGISTRVLAKLAKLAKRPKKKTKQPLKRPLRVTGFPTAPVIQ